jgi:hypothetical protein
MRRPAKAGHFAALPACEYLPANNIFCNQYPANKEALRPGLIPGLYFFVYSLVFFMVKAPWGLFKKPNRCPELRSKLIEWK